MRPTIEFINYSSVYADADLVDTVEALKIQVTRDFSPIWNVNANLVVTPNTQKPSLYSWWLGVFDNSTQAGALGFHDFTTGSQPLGKVFAADDLKYGSSVSVTISHETLELLGDPWISDCILSPDGSRFWCREVADAVEADELGYIITIPNGKQVLVSDFQTQAWFGGCPGSKSMAKYDFLGHCTQPFQVLPGGYQAYMETSTGQWRDATADGHNVASRKAPGSRYQRRRCFREGSARTNSTVQAAA